MDKKEIRKEIAALINSIKEHSDNIGDKQHIPQLELELILNKIEKLYKKSIVFNHLNSSQYNDPVVRPEESKLLINIEPETIQPIVKSEEIILEEPIKPVDIIGDELKAPENEKPEKKIEKKAEKPVTSNIQKPSLSDIRSAIGLNDKFQFSNELFEANIQEFEIAIQQLNTAGSLDSAMEYFLSLQRLYNWKEDNDTSKRLLELVERRYS
jgi:hypothetical protein